MRKRMIRWSIYICLILVIIFLCGNYLREKNSHEKLLLPEIMKENLIQTQKRIDDRLELNPKIAKESAQQEKKTTEINSFNESDILPSEENAHQEPTLVEKISNPRLEEWPWDEYEKPFISYASALDLEGQRYEYMPRAGLESATSWGEEIIYDLVLHPETVEEYGAILTQSSVEAWKAFQWIYANPESYYCYTYTHSFEGDGEYFQYDTRILILPEYSRGDLSLDRTLAEGVDQELLDFICIYPQAMYDIGLIIDWEYERKSGLIQIRKMDYREMNKKIY